jgi:plastocyanin
LASSVPNTLLDLNINDGTNGQVLSTDGSGNFSFIDAGSSGGDPDQNLFATVAADSGTTTADTTTDTLTIAGGTDISTSISGDTLTLSYTGSGGGAANLDELTDVSSAGIDVNDIYEAAIVTLRVDNNGSIAYTFDSHYTGDNPTVYAISGTTIAFDLDLIGGHPFELQDSGGTPISDGLVHVSATGTVSTGSAAQGFDSGTLYWRIQESLSGNYQYQCTIHSGMNGTITVKRLSTL